MSARMEENLTLAVGSPSFHQKHKNTLFYPNSGRKKAVALDSSSYLCMCVLMPEVDSGVFLRYSLPQVPGAESHLNLASQLAPRILSLPPEHWGHRQATRPAGHVGAEDLISGLHTCAASDLPNKPSPFIPRCYYLEILCFMLEL